MKLTNKIFLVTGASGGIGSAICQRLAKEGANLLVVGRNVAQLESLIQTLCVAGGDRSRFTAIAADLTESSGRAEVEKIVRARGMLAGVIQAAAINDFRFLMDYQPLEMERTIVTNVLSPMLLTQSLLTLLAPDARMIFIGSSFGAIGYPGYSVYCASKFALRGFTEALRRELADQPLQLAYLGPRATSTRMNSAVVNAMNQALGNSSDKPEVVAEVVEQMLAAKIMRDRFIGWPERLFVKLNAWFPGLVDSALRKQLPIIRQFHKKARSPSQMLVTDTFTPKPL